MHKDVLPKKHNPVIFITVALILNLVFLIWMASHVWRAYLKTKMTTEQQLKNAELCGIIIYLDEVLTMSARMAAATGDLQWEDRYRRFEPKLDAAIKEAMKLAPDAYTGEASAKTSEANIKLVEMENRAFDLIRQGRQDKAEALLFSDEYEAQKQIYAQGMTELSTNLSAIVATSLGRTQRAAFMHTIMVILVIVIIVIGWLFVIHAVRDWKKFIEEKNLQLAKQTEELIILNKDLEASRTAALNMMMDTEEARKKLEQSRETLKKNMKALERFNRMAVGRESRMIELKQEVNVLLRELGRKEKYQSGNADSTREQI